MSESNLYPYEESLKLKNKKTMLIVLIFACLFLAVRMFLVRFHTDPLTGFYDVKDNFFLKGFDYLVALSVVFIFISQFFMYKKGKSYEMANTYVQGSQTLIFSSALIAFLMLAASFMQGFELISNYNSLDFHPSNEMLKYLIKNNIFDLLTVVVSIPTAIYFFLTAAKSSEKAEPDDEKVEENSETLIKVNKNSGYVILSFFPIIWVYFRLLKCFFDMTSPINSPTRAYEISCLVAVMLYFLSESGFLTQKYSTAKFFTFAYISVILLSMSALPTLIYSSLWILEPSRLIIYYAIEMAFVLYILSRIYSQLRYSNFYRWSPPNAEK